MLDEDISIIDLSLKENNSTEETKTVLVVRLKKLTPKEMIGFRLRTDKLYDSYIF
jgi:hypothetical protein